MYISVTLIAYNFFAVDKSVHTYRHMRTHTVSVIQRCTYAQCSTEEQTDTDLLTKANTAAWLNG